MSQSHRALARHYPEALCLCRRQLKSGEELQERQTLLPATPTFIPRRSARQRGATIDEDGRALHAVEATVMRLVWVDMPTGGRTADPGERRREASCWPLMDPPTKSNKRIACNLLARRHQPGQEQYDRDVNPDGEQVDRMEVQGQRH